MSIQRHPTFQMPVVANANALSNGVSTGSLAFNIGDNSLYVFGGNFWNKVDSADNTFLGTVETPETFGTPVVATVLQIPIQPNSTNTLGITITGMNTYNGDGVTFMIMAMVKQLENIISVFNFTNTSFEQQLGTLFSLVPNGSFLDIKVTSPVATRSIKWKCTCSLVDVIVTTPIPPF